MGRDGGTDSKLKQKAGHKKGINRDKERELEV